MMSGSQKVALAVSDIVKKNKIKINACYLLE